MWSLLTLFEWPVLCSFSYLHAKTYCDTFIYYTNVMQPHSNKRSGHCNVIQGQFNVIQGQLNVMQPHGNKRSGLCNVIQCQLNVMQCQSIRNVNLRTKLNCIYDDLYPYVRRYNYNLFHPIVSTAARSNLIRRHYTCKISLFNIIHEL